MSLRIISLPSGQIATVETGIAVSSIDVLLPCGERFLIGRVLGRALANALVRSIEAGIPGSISILKPERLPDSALPSIVARADSLSAHLLAFGLLPCAAEQLIARFGSSPIHLQTAS